MSWLNPLNMVSDIRNALFPDPSKKAMPYLNQIPGAIKPYYDPFINAGNRALPQLETQYNQLMTDPNAIINRIAAGYKQSPGYQWRMNQGMQGIKNAEAAGGMLGTPEHEQEAATLAENLAGQDYNDYMTRELGLYGTGLQGESGLLEKGYGASGSLADALAQVLAGKSGLAYSGTASLNNMTGSLINGIIAALAKQGAA